jgi:protocatechuate 3,4-dioxygenase beta subunit
VSGVVSDNGTPVGDATVTDPQTGISATTDSNGFYTLPNLPSGRIANLQVARAGQMIASGRVELSPGQAGVSDWTLRPGTGSARPSTSRIIPSTLIVAGQPGLAGTGGIQGIVRDGQGRPVSLALVSVNGVGMVRTNPQGRYIFANVPQGNYQVTVQQGGTSVQTQQVKVIVRQTAQVQMLYKSVGPSAGTTVRTRMFVPGENTVLEGRISDETDQALGRAKVTVIYAGGALSVYSNDAGGYRFRDLKQADYRVLVAKPGYGEAHQSVSIRIGVPATRNFRLRRSSSPYVQQALANQKQGPASSKTVTASTHPASITKPSTPSPHVTSGTAGNPSSKPAGPATTPKIVGKPASTNVPGGSRSTHGASQVQATVGTGHVRGTVIDGKTKAPVAGATVSIKGKPSVQADGSGQFSFSDVAAGSRFISVKKAGYASGGGSVTIRTGQTVVVSLILTPAEPFKRAPAVTRPLKKLP